MNGVTYAAGGAMITADRVLPASGRPLTGAGCERREWGKEGLCIIYSPCACRSMPVVLLVVVRVGFLRGWVVVVL